MQWRLHGKPATHVGRRKSGQSRFKSETHLRGIYKLERVRAHSVAVSNAGRRCVCVQCRSVRPRRLSVASGGGRARAIQDRVNSVRSFNHGSASSAGCERASRRTGAVHAATDSWRTRPNLQQPERRVQKQKNERTSPGVPRLPNMLVQLDCREQWYGELIDKQLKSYITRFQEPASV